MIHKTLDRQLIEHQGSENTPPPDWAGFLMSVSDTYTRFDQSEKPIDNGQTLQQSNQYLDTIINTIADPVFVKNRKHEWILVNEAFCQLLGKTREELIGKSDYDFFPKAQADIFWAKDEEVFATRKENSNEEQITDADGKIRTIVTKKTISQSPNGEDNIVAIIRDVTDIKHSQEQLLLLEAGLLSTADGMVITDVNGTILWANPAFTRLTGYTTDEAIGKNPRILKSGKHDEAFYKNLWDTILAGNIWHGELINKRKDGTFYVEELTINPVKQASEQITHFIAVKQDITNRKESEDVLKSRTRELEMLNRTMVGRELKMIELKETIRKLKQQIPGGQD